jgi:hypothetical protein
MGATGGTGAPGGPDRLAHPWRDGTRAIRLEPLELLERLVALVPAPAGTS